MLATVLEDVNSEGFTENNPDDTSLSDRTIPDEQEAKGAGQNKTRVNEATLDELLRLPGVGAAEANMIIKRRDEMPFSSTVELIDFLELKPHFAARLEDLIDFHSETPDEDRNVDAQEGQASLSAATHGRRVID